MVTLSWNHVNTWRLSQHHLLERASRQDILDVVARIGGLHAQLMSAAELTLLARVRDLSDSDVQTALWHDRTLVKTWAMRGTLHLLLARELPLYVAARSAHKLRRPQSWFQYHGVTAAELAAIVEGVRATLSETGVTREQLADAIAQRTGIPKLRELLRSGWGALLKPSAFQGDLCFGPSQGQNVTFVRPDRWIGDWRPADPKLALQEMARRYLMAYGPATSDEFARWWGMEPGDARRLFRSLAGELAAVEVEGWSAWALDSTIERMRALEATDSVRLLPNFDPYTVAIARHSQYLLPEARKGRVYRPQGWISAVVLVNGRIEGVWEYNKQRAQVVVQVEMFAPPNAQVQRGIEVEASRLAGFLDTQVELVYAL